LRYSKELTSKRLTPRQLGKVVATWIAPEKAINLTQSDLTANNDLVQLHGQ
jgi:hypothetical protein